MVKGFLNLVWLGRKRMFVQQEASRWDWLAPASKDLVQEPLDPSRDVWRGEVA